MKNYECRFCGKECSGKIVWEVPITDNFSIKYRFCSHLHKELFKLRLLVWIIEDSKKMR